MQIVGGRYHWDMAFQRGWESALHAAYGSAIDFYVAVDVVFSSGLGTAGLVFGHTDERDFQLKLSSSKYFALALWDGQRRRMLIDATPIEVNVEAPVRLAIVVEDGMISAYINGTLVGNYRADATFSGGKFGLSVAGSAGTSLSLEFDNFELRRKPQG